MVLQRQNLQYGTITDNPLSNVATTINSADFAGLIALASNNMYVTLDPEGVYGDPEIINVTAHTAAATSATCARGALGTSARQHPQGTTWVAGVYDIDVIIPCTAATRPTLGLWEGMTIAETDTDRVLVYNGSDWARTGWYSSAGRTGFLLSNGTGVVLTTGVTGDMTWATETTDSDGFITVTSATITVPSGCGGIYPITFEGVFSGNPGTTPVIGYTRTGFAARFMPAVGGTLSLAFFSTVTVALAAGDTFKWSANQNSGGNITITGTTQGWRLGL